VTPRSLLLKGEFNIKVHLAKEALTVLMPKVRKMQPSCFIDIYKQTLCHRSGSNNSPASGRMPTKLVQERAILNKI
jgi:hypothetical protein